jgi:hypothetical protein
MGKTERQLLRLIEYDFNHPDDFPLSRQKELLMEALKSTMKIEPEQKLLERLHELVTVAQDFFDKPGYSVSSDFGHWRSFGLGGGDQSNKRCCSLVAVIDTFTGRIHQQNYLGD